MGSYLTQNVKMDSIAHGCHPNKKLELYKVIGLKLSILLLVFKMKGVFFWSLEFQSF